MIEADNNKPLVSVVIITYKHEAFIAEAIEGVLMQEVDFSVELIIADDCSPDRTAEIVQGYIDNHPKGHWIKYTRHQQNKGMIPNFVWGLNNANGKYIALCEGDDYWNSKNKLNYQFNILENNPNTVLSVHDTQEITMKNSLLKKRSERLDFFDLKNNDQKISLKDILKRDFLFVHTSSFFFRNFVLDYNIIIPFSSGDIPLIILLATKGEIYYYAQCDSSYRHHSGGNTKSIEYKKSYHKLNRKMYQDLRLYLDREYHHSINNVIRYDIARENETLIKHEKGFNKLIPFIRLILSTKYHNYSIRDLIYILRN